MRAEAYQPILAILDEGLWLYRRHFLRFVLIAALWLVPIAIAADLVSVAVSWAEGTLAALLQLAGGVALIVPMLVYLIGGLSRAAIAAAEDRQVRLREALAIHPLHIIRISGYAAIHLLITQFVFLFMSIVPILLFFGLIQALIGIDWTAGGFLFWTEASFVIILSGGLFALVTSCVGMPLAGLAHALQPWFCDTITFSEAKQCSDGFRVLKLNNNAISYVLPILLLSTLVLGIALLGAAPLFLLSSAIGELSLLTSMVRAGATTIGLIILLPPLPIWMALLYHRETSADSGADLAAQIAEWQRLHAAPDLHASSIPSTMPPAEMQILD